jgi:glyoxylase-like metal-dependent hydrolase (beta-lactamase superfamily II)
MRRLLDDLFLFEDTCNVYVIRSGREAVLIDFGSGDVLDHLASSGVDRVTDVLMTHHHRDQGQGLQRAVDAGICIYVPHMEQELFHSVDALWQAREVMNNYNMRQDRFSLLEPVAIDGTLEDYAVYRFGGVDFTIVPTPGHTPGSITVLAALAQKVVAFTGDLISAPGKVWSLAATQWSYNGGEGVAAGVASLLDLKDRQPDMLLPSHGEPIEDISGAIDLLVSRSVRLLALRESNPRLMQLRECPYEAITPHLLWHRASMANTYVLRSESGKALLIDFGYDFITGIAAGQDRAAKRPWLYTLPALKAQFGIEKIDVVVPTHYHDDHVAGFNLLRRVEGTEVWAADSFADILENPTNYDLPCLWYDPITVDRRLVVGVPIQWEEYSFTLYQLPGHTMHAVAIYFEVDGRRVMATGDQYQDHDGLELNYVYANQFRPNDYIASAKLYKALNPDLIITGHWDPLTVTPQYLDEIVWRGEELLTLHNELLPDDPDFGPEGFAARLMPYQAAAQGSEPIAYTAYVRNPYPFETEAEVHIVAPAGWQVDAVNTSVSLRPHETGTLSFQVTPPPDFNTRRARIALDITIDGHRFGQQAEALISAPVRISERTRDGMNIGA